MCTCDMPRNCTLGNGKWYVCFIGLEKRPSRAILKPEAKAEILVGCDVIQSLERARENILGLAGREGQWGLETSSLQLEEQGKSETIREYHVGPSQLPEHIEPGL